MRPLLWLFLVLSRIFRVRIVGMTVLGRGAYDHLRVVTGGELEKATDGLAFAWKGCRIGYEPEQDDLMGLRENDGVTCQFCGEEWHHSLPYPQRDARDRCEKCARKVAERRGVPWETVR